MGTLAVINESEKSQRQQYEERVRVFWETVSLDKLDAASDIMGLVRHTRTLALLQKHVSLKGCHIADLGCGVARFASFLVEQKALVSAYDVLSKVSKIITHPCLTYHQACIPYLSLKEASFDGVVLTDVIAEIDPSLHRLTLSELALLLQRDGWLLCSTPLDLNSYDAEQKFVELIRTEFQIIDRTYSYHRLFVYLHRVIKAPLRFTRAAKDPCYRTRLIEKRQGMMRLWFLLNSHRRISWVWQVIAKCTLPLHHCFKTNRRFFLFLECLSKLIWGKRATTHLILLARKRKM